MQKCTHRRTTWITGFSVPKWTPTYFHVQIFFELVKACHSQFRLHLSKQLSAQALHLKGNLGMQIELGTLKFCFWAQDWSKTEISIGGGALCCGCVGDLVVLHNSSVKYLGGCSNCWPGECDLIGVLGIGNSIALLQIQRVARELENPSCFGAPSGFFGWSGWGGVVHFGLLLWELQRNLQDGFVHLSCQLLVPTNFYLSNLNAFVSHSFNSEWLKPVQKVSGSRKAVEGYQHHDFEGLG